MTGYPDHYKPNEARAERAYRTILGRYEIEDDQEAAITDLVTDLRHLADQYAVDWDALIARVNMHYRAEAVTAGGKDGAR